MMTEMAVVGGVQHDPDVCHSPPFVPSASIRSESMTVEPDMPQANDGVSPDDYAIDIVAPRIPGADETSGQAVPSRPFDHSNFVCLKVLFKIEQVTEVPHLSRLVTQDHKVKLKETIAINRYEHARGFLTVTLYTEHSNAGLQVNDIYSVSGVQKIIYENVQAALVDGCQRFAALRELAEENCPVGWMETGIRILLMTKHPGLAMTSLENILYSRSCNNLDVLVLCNNRI